MPPLISVITPSLNSVRYLEEAIRSVLAQRYPSFEHLVIDGGSTDGTVGLLRGYDHLRWISEPDRGQSDAMNKGFDMARGEIIVYLNADDYFEPGAFHAAIAGLDDGSPFVVGRIRLLKQDGKVVLNAPKIEVREMLRWWLPDAYCYNPAGYFYRREVQLAVGPFNVDDHFTMDFEFLIEAARRFRFKRIDDVLATFRYIPGTKTFENSADEYGTFQRFEHYLELLDADDHATYLEERAEHFPGRQSKQSQSEG